MSKAPTVFPSTARTSTRPMRSSTRTRTTRRCARSGPSCGCPGIACMHCRGTPNARRCCATTRRSSPARASRSTPLTNRLVPRHHAEQRWRRTRSAPQARRAPAAAPGAARHRRRRGTSRPARVVDAALARGEVDGVEDVACALPMAVVPDLVGWPREQRHNLLPWGGATFDILGPDEPQRSSRCRPAFGCCGSPAASSASGASSRAASVTKYFWPPMTARSPTPSSRR